MRARTDWKRTDQLRILPRIVPTRSAKQASANTYWLPTCCYEINFAPLLKYSQTTKASTSLSQDQCTTASHGMWISNTLTTMVPLFSNNRQPRPMHHPCHIKFRNIVATPRYSSRCYTEKQWCTTKHQRNVNLACIPNSCLTFSNNRTIWITSCALILNTLVKHE